MQYNYFNTSNNTRSEIPAMYNACFLSVDYQYDFAGDNGIARVVGDSPRFIENELVPFLRTHGIGVHEIISDYRLPRGKSNNEACVPGTIGYQSLLPDYLRVGDVHVKCMHNPIWVRKNIGVPNSDLGKEYQDPELFDLWVAQHFPNKSIPIVIFGETMECCVLSTAQELYFRGYDIYILYEATDPMQERQALKDVIATNSTLSIYAKTIHFSELSEHYG